MSIQHVLQFLDTFALKCVGMLALSHTSTRSKGFARQPRNLCAVVERNKRFSVLHSIQSSSVVLSQLCIKWVPGVVFPIGSRAGA
jgi:hypothetical protein